MVPDGRRGVSKRVAIFGASGLVGTAVVERLLKQGRDDIVPLIHSSGNAWRLASQGIPLKQVDLLDKATLQGALNGCTHVVNCSRGEDDFMIQGLRNLLEVARAEKVERFVHLSSVAVYGDPPHPLSITEDAPTEPAKGSYGWVKLHQDTMVAKAAKEGLNAITLCPPNIGGPSSYFLIQLTTLLRAGGFALLEDGATCCNVVDVANLAAAVESALERGPNDGKRVFVTDQMDVTWRDVIGGLAPLAGVQWAEIPRITRKELAQVWPPAKEHLSVTRAVKHVLSSDVRRALRKDPLLRKVDQTLRDTIARFGSVAEGRVRKSLYGSLRPSQVSVEPELNYQICAQQLRGIRHSSARATQTIGYKPPYSFQESMAAFAAWYRWHHGFDSPFSDLTRELF